MPGLRKYLAEAIEHHNEVILNPALAIKEEAVTFKEIIVQIKLMDIEYMWIL